MKHSGKKYYMIPLFILGFFLFGLIVMLLWNAILPQVTGVTAITFWQAIGLLALSKILFGGFRYSGGWSGGGYQWKHRMENKWAKMTPEEREKLKQEWRARCGPWRKFSEEGTTTEKESFNNG